MALLLKCTYSVCSVLLYLFITHRLTLTFRCDVNNRTGTCNFDLEAKNFLMSILAAACTTAEPIEMKFDMEIV